MAGILCIVAGAYLLQIQSTAQGWFAPFKAIIQQPGPRRMLSVALIYSFTSNFDKIGVQNSSPLFWSLSITSMMTVGFLIMLYLLRRSEHSHPTHQHLRNPHRHRTFSGRGAFLSQYGPQLRAGSLRHLRETNQYPVHGDLGHHVLTRGTRKRAPCWGSFNGHRHRNTRNVTKPVIPSI